MSVPLTDELFGVADSVDDYGVGGGDRGAVRYGRQLPQGGHDIDRVMSVSDACSDLLGEHYKFDQITLLV